MVVELKTQVNELSDQVKRMTTFIQQIIGTSTGEQVIIFIIIVYKLKYLIIYYI